MSRRDLGRSLSCHDTPTTPNLVHLVSPFVLLFYHATHLMLTLLFTTILRYPGHYRILKNFFHFCLRFYFVSYRTTVLIGLALCITIDGAFRRLERCSVITTLALGLWRMT